jgi:hypothetical protein
MLRSLTEASNPGLQKSRANGSFLIASTARWQGHEWLIRVDLTIVEGDIETILYLLVGRGAQVDPARRGQGFEPSSDIDPVAKDVAVLDDDIAYIDAHAEFDAPSRRNCGVAGSHLTLQLHRAAHRVDDASELDKETADCLYNPAVVLGNFGIGEVTTDGAQRGERTFFVLTHQPRVAGKGSATQLAGLLN